MTRVLPNISEIPTAEIVQEFEYLLHNSPDLEIRHKPCGTVFRNIDSVIIDGLLWMRSHHHECGNELIFIANTTFVRVYQDGDGVTVLEVTYNPARGPRETQTKSMRLYPKNYPKKSKARSEEKELEFTVQETRRFVEDIQELKVQLARATNQLEMAERAFDAIGDLCQDTGMPGTEIVRNVQECVNAYKMNRDINDD